MLKQLNIQNFQSHEDTTVGFAPGISAVVGGNNVGKTSILRALRWLVWNRPRGNNIIRHGQKAASVILQLADGTEIKRYKERSGVNEYYLNDERFEALGTDVPPQIADKLNLNDINFQNQLDTTFLALDSPGKIASAINDVVHLEDATKAADSLSASVRECQRRAKDLAEKENALQCDLRPFERLSEYGTLLDQLKAVWAKYEGSVAILAGVGQLVESISSVDGDLARISVPAGAVALLDGVGGLAEECGKRAEEFGCLDSLLGQVEKVDRRLAGLKVPREAIQAIDETDECDRTMNRLGLEFSVLGRLVTDVIAIDNQFVGLDRGYKKAIKEHDELLEQLDICPTCEQDIDNGQRALVVENMR